MVPVAEPWPWTNNSWLNWVNVYRPGRGVIRSDWRCSYNALSLRCCNNYNKFPWESSSQPPKELVGLWEDRRRSGVEGLEMINVTITNNHLHSYCNLVEPNVPQTLPYLSSGTTWNSILKSITKSQPHLCNLVTRMNVTSAASPPPLSRNFEIFTVQHQLPKHLFHQSLNSRPFTSYLFLGQNHGQTRL